MYYSIAQRQVAFVYLGCCDSTLQTGYLINNRNLLLRLLAEGNLISGCHHGQVLMKTLFWEADC